MNAQATISRIKTPSDPEDQRDLAERLVRLAFRISPSVTRETLADLTEKTYHAASITGNES